MLNLIISFVAFSVLTMFGTAFASDFTPTQRTSYTESDNVKSYSSVSRYVAPTTSTQNQKATEQIPTVPANIQNKILQANNNQLQAQDIKQLGSALSFAKSALIDNTELAKAEFGMSDTQKPQAKPQIQSQEIISEDTVKFDQTYNTPQYRDIFYTSQDSALVNQAIDYLAKGKKMIVKPRRFIIEKTQIAVKPIIHVSSVMYNDPTYWVIFTNIGKFTYAQPSIGEIKISESSNNQIEFIIPLKANLQSEVKKLGKNPKMRNISIQQNFIAVTLRTGECLFAKELEITTKCGARIEEIEKQVEI